VRGAVSDDASSIEPLAWDFGQLRRVPAAVVVRPEDAADVSAVLRYASSRGIAATARGTGYSMNGQSLSYGGISLDLRTVSGVRDVADSHVIAGAGTTWNEITEAALRVGRVPPVMTSNPWATAGGTISVGGIGTSSSRHGSHACNCLGLTVVTGDGTVVDCCPERDRGLFDAVRCGLGQFGVITEVRVRVAAHRPRAMTWTLLYRDLDLLLADMQRVVEADRALAIGADVRRDEKGWWFPLQVSFDADSGSAEIPPDVRELSAPRHPDVVRGHPSPAPADGGRAPEFGSGDHLQKAHPWIDSFMPWRSTAEYVRTLLEQPAPAHAWTIALWPVRRSRLAAPLLVTPADEFLMGVSVLPNVPRARLGEALAVVENWSATSIRMGGKRYLSGWVGFDATGWREHYGTLWSELQRMKRRCDPAGILNPGAIRWR
jgi:cytokinin dehydrogenase